MPLSARVFKDATRSVRPELKKPGMNSNRNKLCTGEERLSDGVARRWRDAPSKKSPWICRSGTRQSVCSSGAGALPSLRNFDPLSRSVLLLCRKPRRIRHAKRYREHLKAFVPEIRRSDNFIVRTPVLNGTGCPLNEDTVPP